MVEGLLHLECQVELPLATGGATFLAPRHASRAALQLE